MASDRLRLVTEGQSVSYYFKGNAIRVEAMRDMVNDRGQIPQELRDAGLEQAIRERTGLEPECI